MLDSKASIIVKYKNLLVLSNSQIINKITDQNATRETGNSKTIIDHVLVDKNIGICGSVNIENNSLSDHKLLTISLEENVKNFKPKTYHELRILDYKKFQHVFSEKINDTNTNSFQGLIDLIRKCKSVNIVNKLKSGKIILGLTKNYLT